MLRYLYVYTAWRRVYFFSGLYGRVTNKVLVQNTHSCIVLRHCNLDNSQEELPVFSSKTTQEHADHGARRFQADKQLSVCSSQIKRKVNTRSKRKS